MIRLDSRPFSHIPTRSPTQPRPRTARRCSIKTTGASLSSSTPPKTHVQLLRPPHCRYEVAPSRRRTRSDVEMLAVFRREVAPSPEGLQQPGEAGGGAAGLEDRFREARPDAVTVCLGGGAAMAYSSQDQSPFLPRLFAAMDDIFCLFQGTIENIAVLKQQYGLSKGATEVILVIEAYRTLRDRGPYPADQVVRDISGKFAFVLYDRSTCSVFMAADADGSVPFYWGVDSEGHLVVSDDAEIAKNACGKSPSPFPKGFFFTTSGGLQSYEHPLNEVKPVPRVDSKGDVCGTTYAVDALAKKDIASIPRAGSAADWSSQY